jgi:hypothetical protein
MNATVKQVSDREQVCGARNEFASMGKYERGQLAAWGTAFTTWEDRGEAFCRELNRLANDWRAREVRRQELEQAGQTFRANVTAAPRLWG